MGLEDSFVITAGDMKILPKMLEAAKCFENQPSDEESIGTKEPPPTTSEGVEPTAMEESSSQEDRQSSDIEERTEPSPPPKPKHTQFTDNEEPKNVEKNEESSS